VSRALPWVLVALAACRGTGGSGGSADAPLPGTRVGPELSPADPRARVDALTCTGRGPMSWEHDDEPVDIDGDTVSPWELAPGRWACRTDEGRAEVEVGPVGGNLLVVLLDDIGVDKIGHYGTEASSVAPTPNLDRMAAEGVRFDAAYATPLCSPSRAAMLTGKQPSRTGLGGLVRKDDTDDWLAGHLTFATLLRDHGYATSVAGKWHLSGSDPAFFHHPADHGFQWFRGTMNNPAVLYDSDLRDPGYFQWQENDNGTLVERSGYLTSATVDDAVQRMAEMPEPWLLYVPMNAAHIPLHTPPSHLLSPSTQPPYEADVDTFEAMVDATDDELGRLLAGLGEQAERTTVVVMGDNGTQHHGIRPPLDPERTKGAVYEGGVRVPMYVMGPLVSQPGAVSDALVHITDVFAAARDLAGLDDDGDVRDAVSFLPYVADPALPSRREVLFVERFDPNGFGERESYRRMVRDDRYKLRDVSFEDGQLQLFRITPGVLDEGEPIDDPTGDDAEAYDRLRDALTAQVDALATGAPGVP